MGTAIISFQVWVRNISRIGFENTRNGVYQGISNQIKSKQMVIHQTSQQDFGLAGVLE